MLFDYFRCRFISPFLIAYAYFLFFYFAIAADYFRGCHFHFAAFAFACWFSPLAFAADAATTFHDDTLLFIIFDCCWCCLSLIYFFIFRWYFHYDVAADDSHYWLAIRLFFDFAMMALFSCFLFSFAFFDADYFLYWLFHYFIFAMPIFIYCRFLSDWFSRCRFLHCHFLIHMLPLAMPSLSLLFDTPFADSWCFIFFSPLSLISCFFAFLSIWLLLMPFRFHWWCHADYYRQMMLSPFRWLSIAAIDAAALFFAAMPAFAITPWYGWYFRHWCRLSSLSPPPLAFAFRWWLLPLRCYWYFLRFIIDAFLSCRYWCHFLSFAATPLITYWCFLYFRLSSWWCHADYFAFFALSLFSPPRWYWLRWLMLSPTATL